MGQVDAWVLYDNSEAVPVLLDWGEKRSRRTALGIETEFTDFGHQVLGVAPQKANGK